MTILLEKSYPLFLYSINFCVISILFKNETVSVFSFRETINFTDFFETFQNATVSLHISSKYFPFDF